MNSVHTINELFSRNGCIGNELLHTEVTSRGLKNVLCTANSLHPLTELSSVLEIDCEVLTIAVFRQCPLILQTCDEI